MPIRYDVVAHFNASVCGRRKAHTREQRIEPLFAEMPEAAARMWLWRLSSAEREATCRLVVFAPKAHRVYETYQGPEVRFERRGGKLVELK